MGNDKTNIFLVAIVGIVAVAGLVFLFSGKGSSVTEGSISGDAIFSSKPACKLIDSLAHPEFSGITGDIACRKVDKSCVAGFKSHTNDYLNEGEWVYSDYYFSVHDESECKYALGEYPQRLPPHMGDK